MKSLLCTNPKIKSARALFILLIIIIILIPVTANAKVIKVEIISREIVSSSAEYSSAGAYERITGIIYLEVDPNDPANKMIVDLKYAPQNERGMVEFSTEFELHKPVDTNRGNHRLMYFVNNRGNKMGEEHFNYQTGKNWLYSQGYSYLWCGWNCDVIEGDQRFNIYVPIATDKGEIITGKIYAEIISFANNVTFSQPIVWGGSLVYAPLNMDKSDTKLTMRQYRHDEPIEIPRTEWEFASFKNGKITPDSGSIYIKEGFKPGWLYDLVYVGKNPKVTGLGLAAIRDVVSFFRYEKADEVGNKNPLVGIIEKSFAWGHSQSARLLNHFVYQNFNGDEKKQIVFDGIMLNCPGAGKGLFNSRFAQFTRHGSQHEDNLFPIDFFPFATVMQDDPISGKIGDAFDEARKSGFMPKMMIINSSTDYWTRGASLLHTDVEGKTDIDIDSEVRIYSIAGYTHVDSRIGIIGRALLTALDQWVSFGIEPPVSRIPKISDGTLVSLDEFKKNFPDIPNIIMPESFYQPLRLDMGSRWETDGIADNVPPKIGKPYVCLVPQVDKDGNEIAGIQLPAVQLSLATFVGWSMRNPSFSNSLKRNTGSVYPMPVTTKEQKHAKDPRKAILERYPTREDYLAQITKSLLHLKSKRFLLDEDVTRLLMEFAQLTYWPVAISKPLVTINRISAQPAEVEAGNTMLIFVEFSESKDQVLMVKASFREANDVKFILNDEGKNGDEKAGDNVWSCAIEIPVGVPSGQFHFDFNCIDRNLDRIYVKDTLKEGMGEEGSLMFAVKK